MTKKLLITGLISLWTCLAFAQDNNKKYWLSGSARNVINLDEIHTDDDSLVTSKVEYGHTLVDLSANIKPNDDTYINAILRVRNEYGGFWGSGVTFDLRQLYMKGLIANAIRYQLGDFSYKLTPFTFYNNYEEMYENSLDLLRTFSDIIHYDYFYFDNTWRQQGAAIDFSLEFKDYLDEIQFNMFTSRLNSSNFSTISDRIFYGGNITMLQSEHLSFGVNYVNVQDVAGTSNSMEIFKNPVFTASYALENNFDDFKIKVEGESGRSELTTENDPYAPLTTDFFHYSRAHLLHTDLNTSFSLSYRNVGPNFRSTAAQSRRLRYTSQSEQFTRYTNDQIVRPIGLWDIYNDASLYNTTIETGLSEYYPEYNNIDPFGMATPNRKGFDFALERIDKEHGYEFLIKYGMFSDVVGQGVEELKKYNSLETHLKMNFGSLFMLSNNLILEMGYYNYQTSRVSSVIDFSAVDLKSNRFNCGLNIELSEEFSILSAVEKFTSSGYDLISKRDVYDDVFNFERYDVDLKESIYAFGLMYTFNQNNNLKLIYQDYTWDNTTIEQPKYSFDRMSLVFNMKF